MGRGRAKAKQQKVARDLKYNSQFTDLDALQRELGGPGNPPASSAVNGDEDSDEDAEYEDDRWTGTSH